MQIQLIHGSSSEESPGSSCGKQAAIMFSLVQLSLQSITTPYSFSKGTAFCLCLISVSSPLYWVCLTGIQMKGYDYVSVNRENDRVRFQNMDSYYKRGIPYHGEVGA